VISSSSSYADFVSFGLDCGSILCFVAFRAMEWGVGRFLLESDMVTFLDYSILTTT